MIDWVHQACKDWGRAQYWLMFKGDGYPSRSILGKLIEEGHGASCNQFTREFPEVLSGENLIVANAVKTLSELPRALINVHYVLRLPARDKYTSLEMPRSSYYDAISAAHIKLANAIEAQKLSALRRQKLVRTD